MTVPWKEQSLIDRMVTAVDRVRDRLNRSTAALEVAGVPYAVCGGNAVAAWVATVDPAAVRNTQGIDILFRRADLMAAERALSTAGFLKHTVKGVDIFLDGRNARPRDAVHVVIAGEKVRRHDSAATPGVAEAERRAGIRVLSLSALTRMELTAFHNENQMHLRDMLEVGLIDASWTAKLPPELAERLQTLIDTPEG